MNRKKLKRIFIIAVIVLVLAGMGSCAVAYFMDSSMMYGELDEITDGAAVCMPHNYRKACFIYQYSLTIDEYDKAVLTIPDYCGEYRITQMGGYIGIGAPCHFYLQLNGYAPVWSSIDISGLPVNQYMLEVNLGPYIKHISAIMTVKDNADYRGSFCYRGNGEYRQYLVYVNCSEDNPYFYSVDGRLYNKKDDTLVTKFAYWADREEQ